MNKNDDGNQIAKKGIFCFLYQSFNVRIFLQITNVYYQQHWAVYTNL